MRARHWRGWHWAIGWQNGYPFVNIPYRPHCVLVIARGRLLKNLTFSNWLPCFHRLRMNHCCNPRAALYLATGK